MNFQRWNIGLDIQPGKITALGIQPRGRGWQLRHWWQHPYHCPQTDPLDIAARRQTLLPLLLHWKTLLPVRGSLRIGLPPHLVLQRDVSVPVQVLREPACGHYLRAAAQQLVPEGMGPLTVDYQRPNFPDQTAAITIASREVLAPWFQLFRQAGLKPAVFELMPASLAVALAAVRPSSRAILVYRSAEFWVWAINDQGTFSSGWQYRQYYTDAEEVCRSQSPKSELRYFCSDTGRSPPPGFLLFQPLSAITHRYPPQPINESSFTLATGLALRTDDGL